MSVSKRVDAITKLNEDLEEKNRAKYGKKEWDIISQAYRVSKTVGNSYCGFSALKYITRFVGNSPKSNNPIDIDKAIDFLMRIRENLPPVTEQKPQEVIEK